MKSSKLLKFVGPPAKWLWRRLPILVAVAVAIQFVRIGLGLVPIITFQELEGNWSSLVAVYGVVVACIGALMSFNLSEEDRNRKATIVLEHIIQASDVSHTMQHWHVYRVSPLFV